MFGLGVGLTVISLELIDKALPEFELEDNVFGEVPKLLYRPLISFLLGFGFTLITMSVSISLGLLVPAFRARLYPEGKPDSLHHGGQYFHLR